MLFLVGLACGSGREALPGEEEGRIDLSGAGSRAAGAEAEQDAGFEWGAALASGAAASARALCGDPRL
jgi:hypothetical protein